MTVTRCKFASGSSTSFPMIRRVVWFAKTSQDQKNTDCSLIFNILYHPVVSPCTSCTTFIAFIYSPRTFDQRRPQVSVENAIIIQRPVFAPRPMASSYVFAPSSLRSFDARVTTPPFRAWPRGASHVRKTDRSRRWPLMIDPQLQVPSGGGLGLMVGGNTCRRFAV